MFLNSSTIRAKLVRYFAICGFVILIIEVFVFNAKSFQKTYDEKTFSMDQAHMTGFESDSEGGYRPTGEGAAQAEFFDIAMPVGTLHLDASLRINTLTVQVDFADATSSEYRTNHARMEIIRDTPESMIIPCHFSREVSRIRLRFEGAEIENITLRSITVNQPIVFQFSFLRVGLLMLVTCGLYLLLRAPGFLTPYKNSRHSAVFGVITVFFIFVALMQVISVRTGPQSLSAEFRLTEGNQLTQSLVDAFKNGQVHLLEQPPAQLLAMENPYDWQARTEAGFSYRWDHLLYDGKYYSYYGIAPVLLFFLPYHLLTGYYFPTWLAVFLMGGAGIAFLSLVYHTCLKRWFSRIPLGFTVLGLIILQAASGIWTTFNYTQFYEIAQASAHMFVTMGAYFLLSSGLLGSGRPSGLRMALGSAALSFAVMSRPTLAVYCIVALVMILLGLHRYLKSSGKASEESVTASAASDTGLAAIKRNFRKILPLACAAFLPFVLLGGLQMWYNYARFGSMLEFGIQYSLTINDFTATQFHLRLSAIGFYNYLLAFPQIIPRFPFVFSQFHLLDVNGYYFSANKLAIGLFFRALPLFGLFAAGRTRRLLPQPARLDATILWPLFTLAAPAVIIASVWESGYSFRYNTDFNWQMILGSFIVLFTVYEKSENLVKRNLMTKFFAVSAVSSLITNFALTLTGLEGSLRYTHLWHFLRMARLFEFWK